MKIIKKKQKGSFLLLTMIVILVLSLLSWALIYTTLSLNTHSQQASLSKKAYYAADAGIEDASLYLWESFKTSGITADKMQNFLEEVQGRYDDFNNTGKYYPEELNFGDCEYRVVIEPLTAQSNDSQVVVRITSTGRSYYGRKNDDKHLDRKIVADVKYYLTGSQLLDFAYFSNNFAWHEGAIRNGGSMGTNGWLSVDGPYIAGGDRYKECKDVDLIVKRDDGGLFSVQGFKDLNYNDYNDIYPRHANQNGNMSVIPMPSLAASTYYENFAKKEETKALGKNEKYGIYCWVPAGTVLYDNSGGAERTVDNGGEYIKICDSVYGDDINGNKNSTGYYLDNKQWKKGERENIVIASPDSSHPVKVYGTVVVKENVAIKGIIDGSGSIYSGRNIYVMGGVEYKDKPSKSSGNSNSDTLAGYRGFSGNNDSDNSYGTECPQTMAEGEENQENWMKSNLPDRADKEGAKDLLGLFANGSICVGDMSQKGIRDNMASLLNNDMSDASFMTGTIKIVDENGKKINEKVNLNESNESSLGIDQVPNTRKSKVKNKDNQYVDSEYRTETNNQWDVNFYTSENPPPEDPNNPGLYAINPATGQRFEILDEDFPNGNYNSWTDNQKKSVIPGSGEDLDSDGVYDSSLDITDIIAYSDSDASAIRSKDKKWDEALSFIPSQWGGNVDFEGKNMDYSSLFKGYNPPDKKGVYRLDALTYTNHMWGGYLEGPLNGCLITRIESTTISSGASCPINHDDRIAGGGESLRKNSIIMPQTEHMEFINWIE
jgi:hypothetical protein